MRQWPCNDHSPWSPMLLCVRFSVWKSFSSRFSHSMHTYIDCAARRPKRTAVVFIKNLNHTLLEPISFIPDSIWPGHSVSHRTTDRSNNNADNIETQQQHNHNNEPLRGEAKNRANMLAIAQIAQWMRRNGMAVDGGEEERQSKDENITHKAKARAAAAEPRINFIKLRQFFHCFCCGGLNKGLQEMCSISKRTSEWTN